MTDDQENAEERYCLQALANLRKSYETAAQKYIDRLVRIRSLQTPAPIVLTLDQAHEFINVTMNMRAP